jgi:PilZ domain
MSTRIHARVMVQRRVEYRYAQGQGEGMLLNLSLQGCRIKGAPPFPCGTRLRLELWLLEQSQSVKVELAAVRWVKDDQFGVSFLNVPPDARARLKQVFQLLQEA